MPWNVPSSTKGSQSSSFCRHMLRCLQISVDLGQPHLVITEGSLPCELHRLSRPHQCRSGTATFHARIKTDTDSTLKSAFARYVLNNQLSAVALLHPAMEGRTETDSVFNDGGCFVVSEIVRCECSCSLGEQRRRDQSGLVCASFCFAGSSD
jgi:hypothetical protein